MDPQLRAAADKLIFDLANVKVVATALPKGALDRRVEATGRTLRETFAEIAARQYAQAEGTASYFAGRQLDAAGLEDEPAYQRERKRLGHKPALKDVFSSLEQSRDRLIRAYEAAAPPDEALSAELRRQAHHIEPHAIDFAEAAPEIRLEPMLLTWALEADFGDDAALSARQLRLYEAVRAELDAMHGDEDGDEDGGDEEQDAP